MTIMRPGSDRVALLFISLQKNKKLCKFKSFSSRMSKIFGKIKNNSDKNIKFATGKIPIKILDYGLFTRSRKHVCC